MAHDRGVILDVDGTLIDSNDAHARAWAQAGQRLGYDLTFEQVRPLIGMGGDRVLAVTLQIDEDSPEGRELEDMRARLFRRHYLPELQPFPGARDLLERLRDDGFDLVVATSASDDDLRSLLDRARVADLIRDATSSSDAEDSKPAPDIVEGAVSRANVPRSGLLMIGDTPYDVEAARRARVPLVAVRCGGWSDPELDGAVAIYDDPEDLLEHYEEVFLSS